MQDYLEDFVDSKFYLKEKGIKFVTSLKNQVKSYTQVNGNVALCQKANQQFNWHGDFVFEKASKKLKFDEQLLKLTKLNLSIIYQKKLKNMLCQMAPKPLRLDQKLI